LPAKASAPMRARLREGERNAPVAAPDLKWPGGRAGTRR
jgi:hypothetical protein